MAPLAPVITQTAPNNAPVSSGTTVATLAPGAGETDPGPFTYAESNDPGGAFTISGTNVVAAKNLSGSYVLGVTVTTAAGTSPPGAANLVFQDPNPWDDVADPYGPQIPPPLAPGVRIPWTYFMNRAIRMVVPQARDGVDYVVARSAKNQSNAVSGWNTALLGAYPTAQVQLVATQLAAQSPYNIAIQ